MKRRQARENAMIASFEESFHANTIEEIAAMSHDCGEYELDAYGQALLMNFYAHSAEVEDAIIGKLKDWTLARLPRVSAAILRIAVTEMMYSTEDMDSIVINEAVEIAKKYTGDDDYQFINGVLGSIARDLHGENALPADGAAVAATIAAIAAADVAEFDEVAASDVAPCDAAPSEIDTLVPCDDIATVVCDNSAVAPSGDALSGGTQSAPAGVDADNDEAASEIAADTAADSAVES